MTVDTTINFENHLEETTIFSGIKMIVVQPECIKVKIRLLEWAEGGKIHFEVSGYGEGIWGVYGTRELAEIAYGLLQGKIESGDFHVEIRGENKLRLVMEQ